MDNIWFVIMLLNIFVFLPPIAYAFFTCFNGYFSTRVSRDVVAERLGKRVRDGWTNIARRFQFSDDDFHLTI